MHGLDTDKARLYHGLLEIEIRNRNLQKIPTIPEITDFRAMDLVKPRGQEPLRGSDFGALQVTDSGIKEDTPPAAVLTGTLRK